MTVFVGLLRAVNVGGIKLAMADLRALCEAAGFGKVRTYIQSGNVVFESELTEAEVKARLEGALAEHLGREARVMVRTAAEMAAVAEANPFPAAEAVKTVVVFLDEAPAKDALEGMVAPDGEEAVLGEREIWIHYVAGQGRSKLKLKAAAKGTARNLNSVRKLAEMSAE